MSSMRNAVQRRNHKERAQPIGREKWGLLEKHKDYKLRAKDHKDKQMRLKILKEKAVNANPDEFSFKMMSSRTRNGQRIQDRGNEALSMDVVRLLKTQDAGYIRTMLQKTRREREKLEAEFQVGEGGRIRALRDGSAEGSEDEEDAPVRKMRFVDTAEEQDEFAEDDEEEEDELEEDDKPTKNLSRRESEAKKWAEVEARRALKKRKQQQEKKRDLLEAVRKRENDLAIAEQELEIQRAKMSNSIGGVNKNGVKFKIRERKR